MAKSDYEREVKETKNCIERNREMVPVTISNNRTIYVCKEIKAKE